MGLSKGSWWDQEVIAGPPEHRRDGPHAEGVVDRVDKGEEQDTHAGECEEDPDGEVLDPKCQPQRNSGNHDCAKGQPG